MRKIEHNYLFKNKKIKKIIKKNKNEEFSSSKIYFFIFFKLSLDNLIFYLL